MIESKREGETIQPKSILNDTMAMTDDAQKLDDVPREDLLRTIDELRGELDALRQIKPPVERGDVGYDEGDIFPEHSKAGYLFKWQDREIGWGGTKWALRFVKLDVLTGQLVCFWFDCFILT